MAYQILVVEDDVMINQAITIYLRNQKYQVYNAYNGEEALEEVRKHKIHLAVVDIMMPVMDGFEFTLKVREKYDFPIIFLSAKSEDVDKITGLNIGADDYITKPFKSMELLARVHSQLRRYEQILKLRSGSKEIIGDNLLTVGDLTLDTFRKEVKIYDRPVKLTPKEFQILELLMRSPGRVYSAKQIYELVWQEEAISTETIMVHIRKLREKIEIDPNNPAYLKVVWGVGYKIERK